MNATGNAATVCIFGFLVVTGVGVGATYGLPWCAATEILYYNEVMFDAAGVAYSTKNWSYADYQATPKALTQYYTDGTTAVYARRPCGSASDLSLRHRPCRKRFESERLSGKQWRRQPLFHPAPQPRATHAGCHPLLLLEPSWPWGNARLDAQKRIAIYPCTKNKVATIKVQKPAIRTISVAGFCLSSLISCCETPHEGRHCFQSLISPVYITSTNCPPFIVRRERGQTVFQGDLTWVSKLRTILHTRIHRSLLSHT